MPKGPILNDISKRFTTRDSLGIEGVATTIQASICPIINTVTPRVFYWPFLVWIYYDYYRYSGVEKAEFDTFSQYLKRQDYFFVMANLLIEGSDRSGLNGKQQTLKDRDKAAEGPYEYNSSYFQSKYGGMQYYNAGCLSMYFIVDKDPDDGRPLTFPKLTKEGEHLALAFQAVIKNTEYYKNYRKRNVPVPRNILEEYGRVIRFDFRGFTECKEIMKKHFFEDTRAIQLRARSELLTESREYVELLVREYNIYYHRTKQNEEAYYLHNLRESILSQVRQIITDDVQGINIAVPYYDKELTAYERLQDQFPNAVIQLYIQNHKSTFPVDYNHIHKVANHINPFAGFRHEKDNYKNNFYHGKVFLFQSAEKSYVLYGSANCTQMAFIKSHTEGGNIECDLLEVGTREEFGYFFDNIEVRKEEKLIGHASEFVPSVQPAVVFKYGEVKEDIIYRTASNRIYVYCRR